MKAQGQLHRRDIVKGEGRTRQSAVRAEHDAGALRLTLHQCRRIGRNADQGFGTGQEAGHLRCGRGGAVAQPRAAPAQGVGRQAGQHDLQLQAGWRTAHQMLDTERPFQLLVPRLNGLITNDKFCMSRAVRLKLTWSRRPLRLRRPSTGESTYPLNENNRCGGADETPMANSSKSAAETGRATPMGPSLPTPSAMGSDGFTGNGQSTDSVFPATSGGVS